jgi:phosphoglycerate dehydrogenase-like enzyme
MLVLSEKIIDSKLLPEEIYLEIINRHNIKSYSGNSKVMMLICSRKMAIMVCEMDFPNLKLIQLTSAGFDGVPILGFTKKNVMVANAGDTYSIPIAETVIYSILSIVKRYNESPKNKRIRLQRNYKYITELSGKSAMIIGTGNIGYEVAKRLSCFDVTVLGYDKFLNRKGPFKIIYNDKENLKKSLPECDFVIATLPDNPDTRNLLNMEFLDCFKKGSLLVNVGRLSVFNKKDLYCALKTKKIGTAVFDMFEFLPNPLTNKFRRLNNVLVLPGVAAISHESKIRLQGYICNNIKAIFYGNEPKFVVNKGDI